VRLGPPTQSFLWPLEIIEMSGVKGYGYIMPLRPKRFASIVDLMKRKVEPTFLSLITAAMAMVESFSKLHQKGLCYRDISFGNVFFDPRSGDILICDNDNIALEAAKGSAVLGTPRFMAPEIVRGEQLPDVKTDLFSLAILLFYMFMIHHPLEGKLEASIKCFDLPAMKRLYGERPVFIFDPFVSSNRPVAGLHDNALIYWQLYPEFFKQMFVKGFTKGIRYRDERPDEQEWLRTLVKLKHSLFKCSCSAENFYDVSNITGSGLKNFCWACKKPLHVPMRMRINDDVIVIGDHVKLYHHYFDKNEQTLMSTKQVVATVTHHPTLMGVKGLKNLGAHPWRVKSSKGLQLLVETGKSCALEDGIQIDFGSTIGFIKA